MRHAITHTQAAVYAYYETIISLKKNLKKTLKFFLKTTHCHTVTGGKDGVRAH